MKKLLVLLCILVPLTVAQNNGKLSGKITDEKTGSPLPGANIIIKGTTLGAASNENGAYFILNVPPGSYTVTVSSVGYQSVTIQEVVVNNSKTTNLNVQLPDATLQVNKEVVITAKTPDVVKDKTSTSENIRMEDVSETPGIRTLTDVVALSADVIDGHFRGGRSGEELYNIQGLGIVNPLDNSVAFTPITSAIEEVEVITSGFSAQYGNAQSGVVNITMKEGSREKWTAYADTRNRVPGYKHFGNNVFSEKTNPYLQLLSSLDKWLGKDPLTDRFFYDYIGYGFSTQYRDTVQAAAIAFATWRQAKRDLNREYDNLWDKSIEFNLGGPLSKYARVFLAAHIDNTWAEIPGYTPNPTNQYMGNLTFDVGEGMSLRLLGSYQERKYQTYSGLTGGESGSTYYQDFRSWMWDRMRDVRDGLQRNQQYGVKFSHALSAATFYDIKLNYLNTRNLEGAFVLDINRYRDDFADLANWRYLMTPDLFRNGNVENEFMDERSRTISLEGSFTSQVTNDHMVLAGLQANWYKIDVHNLTSLSSPVQALDEFYKAYPYEYSFYRC